MLPYQLPGAIVALLLFTVTLYPGQPHADTINEERLLLPVTIDGQVYKLDTLVVRPKRAGRFPVALIANGSADPADRPSVRPDWLVTWAHDFAHRGWLAAIVVWRGYGRSTGDVVDDAGNCQRPEARRYLERHADDLAAALRSLARRPDVEAGHALGIDLSIGGASMLALAARPNHPLAAVINASGGLWHNAKPFMPDPSCTAFEANVTKSFGDFGSAFHGPSLWLYAQNDAWFRPEWVQHLRAAFVGSGGHAAFTEFPPFGEDGHKLFLLEAGRRILIPKIDDFLRANHLPTWDEAGFQPLLKTLTVEDRDLVWSYLHSMPAEKVLVQPDHARGFYWFSGASTLDDARHSALDYCHTKSDDTCHVIVEDFDQIAKPTSH